ncbi:cell cycle control protein 50B [Rhineura floridana]|uniref:cell cycle control protein 50B n=1 Tax=Rhineura floridana TaxID=261503 RepID=UPI002AC7ED79|nr:cell cycle control protein 50B [Rhineura floridana]
MASGSYDVGGSSADPAPAPAPAPTALNKPDNTAFTQQRLPAWQPLLSVGTVLPLFFCLGVVFLALGLGLYFSSQEIHELELDYTGAAAGTNCSACANLSSLPNHGPCICALRFELPVDFPAPVCLYYQLSSYYQNYRGYSVSRDDMQLSGDTWALTHPIDDCVPYQYQKTTPIAPCGSVANSLFNDSFALYHVLGNGSMVPVPLDKRGISWWTDTNVKFRNPDSVNGSLALAFKGTAKPPNWPYPVYDLGKGNPNNTGFTNEDFVVWMRIAALPTFRKLYSRIRQGNFSVGLSRGTYYLNITYNYPVVSFHGTKKVIFSTLSWMGGKNPFLGIAYLVFGSACILTGIVMLVVYFKYRQQDYED